MKQSKKIIKSRVSLFLVLLLILSALSSASSLKAQIGVPGGIYIENQMVNPQAADFWIRNNAKFGPTDSDYIYFDPTVTQASQNNIYVNSSSTAGSFIKLDLGGQEKFKVDKAGDVYASDVYIRNDAKLGQTNNDYIYFDPTVTQDSQNNIYVNSSSTVGSFIKLQINNQDKFKVEKTGDVYMNDLYVNNIVSSEQTSELDSYLYREFDNGYHPYFAVSYHFGNFPSGIKPSGSGNYIFIGANNDANTYGKIYVVKQDTGEIVDSASGSSIRMVAGLAVTQSPVGDAYALWAALDEDGDSNRDIVRFPITFDGPNNEPNITSSGESISPLNGQIAAPFYIRAVANWLYVTDNVNDKIHKFLSGDTTTIMNTLITQTLPYGLHPYSLELQLGSTPYIWVSVYNSGGDTGKLYKRNYYNLTSVATIDISSGCPQPKLMAFDKYNNLWVTCSNTQYYYSNTPYYLGGNRDKIVRVNTQSNTWTYFSVPYYNGSVYQYSNNSLPFGVYYHPNFQQMMVGNRADGRIYRFNLSGQLINCDGTVLSDPSNLTNFEACLVDATSNPVGVMLGSSFSFGNNTDSFWALTMSGTAPRLYRNQSMETLYTGDIYTNGHVASFGEFINDGGVQSAGHEKLVIDVSGYQDKVSFFVDQSNTNNDRGNILFFGNNASTQTGVYEYDFNNFTVNAEKVMIGPYWDGQAAANSVGTKNKGEIYLQGMVVVGSDSNLSTAVKLTDATENLLYGVIDSTSNAGYLLKFQQKNQSTGLYYNKFVVDRTGSTSIAAQLRISGPLKTPGGLEVLGSDLNTSCSEEPSVKTDGTMYVCRWCVSNTQHRTLRVWLLDSWYTIRDNSGSGSCSGT